MVARTIRTAIAPATRPVLAASANGCSSKTPPAANSEADGDDGSYLLTLTGVSPYLTAFTDRPYRESTVVPLRDFVAFWNENDADFAAAPPNAALEIIEAGDAARTFIIELAEPIYDEPSATISYSILPLESAGGAIADFLAASDAIENIPDAFDQVTLFIDSTTTASLAGNVTVDDSGSEPLPGVTVMLDSPTGSMQTTWTDGNGHYSFQNLPSGGYVLTYSFTGFATLKRTVYIDVGSTTKVNVTMQPSS
ncbi:MAG: carboxypeptidase-like regulatory domain-containing protein [Deltaproteobacteria bacterium]|nr:carboxypeptidase-like regulatory domain-containing protein [Deltaproteobacteria bacterium]